MEGQKAYGTSCDGLLLKDACSSFENLPALMLATKLPAQASWLNGKVHVTMYLLQELAPEGEANEETRDGRRREADPDGKATYVPNPYSQLFANVVR